MNKLIIAAALGAAAFCTVVQAAAPEQRAVSVRYSAADLDGASGAAKLYRKLYYAAQSVCGDLDSLQPLPLLSRYHQCVGTALGDAIASIGNRRLATYAASHGILVAGETLAKANNGR